MNEKLVYLLNHLDYYIEQTIYDVLGDSENDPQYSAVTAKNLILCYLEVTHEMGLHSEITYVEEYLKNKCFTNNEIETLRKRIEQESKYYIGKQY